MNPFVNPKKRGFALPTGCKDLIDVLNRPIGRSENPFRVFIRLVLMQAHYHGATELVIGKASTHEAIITERIDQTDYFVSAFPPDVRTNVVNALGEMANLPAGPFPKEGTILVPTATKTSKWKVVVTSPDGEIVFTPVVKK